MGPGSAPNYGADYLSPAAWQAPATPAPGQPMPVQQLPPQQLPIIQTVGWNAPPNNPQPQLVQPASGSVAIRFPQQQPPAAANSVAQAPGSPAPNPLFPRFNEQPMPEPLAQPPSRLESLPPPGAPFATTPHPTPEVAREFQHYVERKIDPQETLDLVLNRPRVLMLTQPPKRVQIPDEQEKIIDYNVLSPTELAVVGKKVGSTVLNLWFADPVVPGNERVLSYLVRVIPDPEAKQRQEKIYEALAEEINRHFPDSHVQLSLVGDKLVVRGEAKDVLEATQILMVLRASAPGNQGQGQGQGNQAIGTANIPVGAGGMFPQNQANMEDELVAGQMGIDAPGAPGVNSFILRGSNNIINLLRIPGEQQVMLKVTVAEV
ncbi:MAG TPA: pilus assembly protein N-terminal domain-containing protein, partial [Pirellulales bacterium]|nr:pilus assembly protein N-terminal domain-containing protein [Pirellulales bacterium]